MFDIDEHVEITNKDITVIFTPGDNVKNYKYSITHNGEELEYFYIDNKEPITILFNETGNYKIKIVTYDKSNIETILESGEYNIDKDSPVIYLPNESIDYIIGSDYNFLDGVTVLDNIDGDISNRVTTNSEKIDFNMVGEKKLVYKVVDTAGNVATKELSINVLDNGANSLMLIQTAILLVLSVLLFVVFKYRKSVNLERRLEPYTVRPIRDTSLSLFDKLNIKYKNLIKGMSKVLKKSVFIEKYSKKYDKYISVYKDENIETIDFISTKVLISLLFLVIAIFSKAMRYEIISSYEFLIPFLAGFFAPDIIYISKYKIYKNKLENDLLQAIIIMNNAFKSGRSITQAILLVTRELDGPIAEEFKKMDLELSFGLSIETVFKRFSERIEVDEVTYLTASLSILNQTGGNIIKVFSSIERSLFNKKKLKLELKALTSSSKIIVYVLFAVPAFFAIFVSMINPGYFLPLITTSFGLVILSIIIIVYILYIIVVKKVMKVRM